MKALIVFLLIGVVAGLIRIGWLIYPLNNPPIRDYQIELNEHSVMVWDGNRFVGSYKMETFSIDSLIKKDQE